MSIFFSKFTIPIFFGSINFHELSHLEFSKTFIFTKKAKIAENRENLYVKVSKIRKIDSKILWNLRNVVQ